MFRFDCEFSNFNCTKRVQLHTILRPGRKSGGGGMTRAGARACAPNRVQEQRPREREAEILIAFRTFNVTGKVYRIDSLFVMLLLN